MTAITNKYSNLSNDIFIGLLLSCLLLFLRLYIQPIITVNNGQGWDGVQYYMMATDIHNQVPLPFRLRIGLPLLVYYLPISDTLFKFQLINLIFGIIYSIVCYVVISKYSNSIFTKLTAWLLVCATGISPIPVSIWYPVNSDVIPNLLFLLILSLSLPVNKKLDQNNLMGGGGVNNFLLFTSYFGLFTIGTIFRENFPIYMCVMLFQISIIPAHTITTYFYKNIQSNITVILNICGAILGSLIGIAIINYVTGISPLEGKTQMFIQTLTNQNLIKVIAAGMNVYGNLLVFIMSSLIITRRYSGIINNKSALLLSLLILIVVSLGGGSNTERFFYWGLIILVFESLPAIDNVFLYIKPVYVVIAIIFMLIFQRFFLPISPEGIAKCDIYSYLFGNATFIGHWIQICNSIESLTLIVFYLAFIGIFGLIVFLGHLHVIYHNSIFNRQKNEPTTQNTSKISLDHG